MFPSFSMTECAVYFTKTLAAVHPGKLFHIPSWIPRLSDPQVEFDLDPPSYQQVTAVIRKMKASGSPCPLDQISVTLAYGRVGLGGLQPPQIFENLSIRAKIVLSFGQRRSGD